MNMKVVKDYAVYLVFRGLLFIVSILPESWIMPLSTFAGNTIHFFDRRDKRTVFTNLRWAYGDSIEKERMQYICRRVFINLVYNLLQFLRIKKYSIDDIREMVDPVNLDYIEDVMKKGKGLIFVTAHFDNWELMGVFGTAILSKYKVISIGREMSNRFIDRYINSIRERAGNKIVPKKNAGFEVMRTLKKNGIVTIFADQAGGNDSIPAEFFGKVVPTISAPVFFSYRTGAPIIPAFLLREGNRYKLFFEKPIVPDQSAPVQEATKKLTDEYTKVLEDCIKRYPERWFWVHKRWKSKKAKKKLANSYNIIIHAPNWIGDAVMALPSIQGIKEIFPNSRITVAAKESVAGLLKACPGIDRIVTIRSRRGVPGIADLLKLSRSLRGDDYDLGIILPNSFKSALLFCLANVKCTVGYKKDARGILLTHGVKRSDEILKLHHRDYYYDLVKNIGKAGEPPLPLIAIDKDVASIADKRQNEKGRLIGIHPGGAYGPAKRWPPERFAQLAKRIKDDWGADIVVFGDKKDGDLAKIVAGGEENGIIDMAGKTDLLELSALMKQCDIVITNDSGPMHIASAVGVPVVAIFGSTNPEVTGPLGVNVIVSKYLECAPCLKRTCPGDYECMKAIEVGDVFNAVKTLLDEIKNS